MSPQTKRSSWSLTKQRLADQLASYPLLRLLLFKFWFRLVFLACLLMVIGIGLLLARVWTTSPPGFAPVVKLRGLDFLRSWSLRRGAQKAAAAGQMDEAIRCWQQAVAWNAGNPALFRGLLQAVVKTDNAKVFTGMVMAHSEWLLRLTRTNQADVPWVAQAYEKCQLYEPALNLLGPHEDRLNHLEQAVLLKCLFNLGRVEAFASRWEKVKGEFQRDPEMQLYGAAYGAGWAPPAPAVEGRQQLEAALADPARKLLANQLLLAVNYQRADAERYAQTLQRLTELRAATPVDEVNYWRLLTANGRKSAALERAKKYVLAPTTAGETIALVQGYKELGLRDSARQLLKQYVSQFGYAEGLWFSYADTLMEDKNWDDLYRLALQIREESPLRDWLAGYSYYVEGLAEFGRQRRPAAEKAFQHAVESGFENHRLGMLAARDMVQMGFPKPASQLVADLKPWEEKNPQYWQLAFDAACALKQTDAALASATAAYQLAPKELLYMNNYAAALLTVRQRADEAIRLTLQLYLANTNSVAAKINHSLALLLNQRTAEAQALLSTVQKSQLTGVTINSFYQAWLDVRLKQRQYALAATTLSLINTNQLFPNEVQWLEQARKEIVAATTPRKSTP